MLDLKPADFEFIRKFVLERSAIVLEPGKEYLVDSRLKPIAREAGYDSISDLVVHLRSKPRDELQQKVIEAMATHETSFFRDVHPFEALKKVVIPNLITNRATERGLNFWCAAASSGQEPYTIAMLLKESFPELNSWNIRFVASDISKQILERARTGMYNQIEVNRGLPATLLVKYFQRNGLDWQIKEDLRRLFDFRQINLIEPWPPLPKMDIVFMRNVLIYFDVETKRTILHKVRQLLRPDGYLFLGGAETTINIDDSFERIPMEKTGCYKLRSR